MAAEDSGPPENGTAGAGRQLPDFQALYNSPEAAAALVREICRRHDLPSECRRCEEGSQIVFSCADRWIVKVFAPEDADYHRAESVFLERLHGRLPFPTPELAAAGTMGPWPYVVMEQLRGTPLARIWPGLEPEKQRRILCELGAGIRVLHSLPISLFRDAPFEWHTFIDGQRETLIQRHRGFGLDESWLDTLPAWLEGIDLHDAERIGPLHTELMPGHVFLTPSGSDEWSISGLIDWEPSMVGHRDYELCAVGIFLAPGRPDLFRAFLSGYGIGDSEATPDFGRKVMAMLLLHRYGNVHRFRSRIPAEETIRGVEDLERYWFGV